MVFEINYPSVSRIGKPLASRKTGRIQVGYAQLRPSLDSFSYSQPARLLQECQGESFLGPTLRYDLHSPEPATGAVLPMPEGDGPTGVFRQATQLDHRGLRSRRRSSSFSFSLFFSFLGNHLGRLDRRSLGQTGPHLNQLGGILRGFENHQPEAWLPRLRQGLASILVECVRGPGYRFLAFNAAIRSISPGTKKSFALRSPLVVLSGIVNFPRHRCRERAEG